MKTQIKTIIQELLISTIVMAGIAACSLDEENPGGFTMTTMAQTADGYQTLINQCYFAMQRYFYGTSNWMTLTEGDTDLWTYKANKSTSYTQWFWYFAGASPNTTYTKNWWNGTYDGIGACNTAIALAPGVPFKTDEERNEKVAEARFLRAVYYFNAVEQFGGVTVITEPVDEINFSPERTDPLTIYKEIIIPDLEFAFKWLPVGNHVTTRPTKKAALGFLAKACLQTVEYDDTKALAADALKYAQMLVEDAESGGRKYNTVLYTHYSEVFDEDNNFNNEEALWKHRWYAGTDGHGSSNGNYKLNRNDEYFGCNIYAFGAFTKEQEYLLTWDGMKSGLFMPTQHLVSLFVQQDGTLDPRFHQSFKTSWTANTDFTWDESTVNKYDRDASVTGKTINKGDLGIKFIMPQDENYAQEKAGKLKQACLVVDYADVYNDTRKNINMSYTGQNATNPEGTENFFNIIYPALTKHNSSHYYVANEAKMRNGNLNATFIMRTAEAYLLAAEADIYVNGGSNALTYINKIRTRAGALPLSGTPTIRTILDERARELCGEYSRFYDLKRTGMLSDATYLQEVHPDLAKFFKSEYALRPIPTSYTEVLTGGGENYQNPGY
jgi:hypothetical protein